jgi:hypothetical protein
MFSRGDTGLTGATGERGPRGDHGQQGERGRPNRLAIVGFCILSFFNFLGLYGAWLNDQHQKQEAYENCIFNQTNRNGLRGVLIDANRRTQTSNQRTAEEKQNAQEFFDKAIKKFPKIECEE